MASRAYFLQKEKTVALGREEGISGGEGEEDGAGVIVAVCSAAWMNPRELDPLYGFTRGLGETCSRWPDYSWILETA